MLGIYLWFFCDLRLIFIVLSQITAKEFPHFLR